MGSLSGMWRRTSIQSGTLRLNLTAPQRCKAEAKKAIQEALAIGEEPAPAKSLLGMVVQKESTGSQDKLSEVELRDEALTFLL